MGKEETTIRPHTSACHCHTTPFTALQCLCNQGTSFQITANALANYRQPGWTVHCKDWEHKHGNNNLVFRWVVCSADSRSAGAGLVDVWNQSWVLESSILTVLERAVPLVCSIRSCSIPGSSSTADGLPAQLHDEALHSAEGFSRHLRTGIQSLQTDPVR